MGRDPLSALVVAGDLVVASVLSPIQFDNKVTFPTGKIDNVRSHGLLAHELGAQ